MPFERHELKQKISKITEDLENKKVDESDDDDFFGMKKSTDQKSIKEEDEHLKS